MVEVRRWYVVDDGTRPRTTSTQVVQREIACCLKNEGFQMVNAAVQKDAIHAQPSLMQQVFGGRAVIDDPLQCAQQNGALGSKQLVERQLTHKSTRPEKVRMIMLINWRSINKL